MMRAELRSELYALFAQAFTHPDEAFIERIVRGELLSRILETGSHLPPPNPFETVTNLATTSEQEPDVFFTTCFESGTSRVPLRESGYTTAPEKSLMEELFRFYRHFGLDVANGTLKELPDALPVELEFLHYLTYLEAAALRSGTSGNLDALQNAQRDFLNRLPGRWVDTLALRLEQMPDAGFYADASNLLARFVRHEKRTILSDSGVLVSTNGG